MFSSTACAMSAYYRALLLPALDDYRRRLESSALKKYTQPSVSRGRWVRVWGVLAMPTFKQTSDAEKGLLRKWHTEGKGANEIAKLLGRDRSTIFRQVARLSSRKKTRPVGRPVKLTKEKIDQLVRKAKEMIKVADAKYQVTAAMIRKGAKLKCSIRAVLDALHSRGVYMRPMREKPVRTDKDEQERLAFSQTYASKPTTFWDTKVDAFLENKFFPVYLTGSARTIAVKRVARGTFRAKGEGLARGHVKPRKGLKVNTGAPSIFISAAISGSKVLMWHQVKGNWNAEAASKMYSEVLAPALKAGNPGKRRFLVLEDNDPSGYKSRRAIETKASKNINVLEIPRRSPDLNPLDYGFWAEVNARMRKQERKFAAGRRESLTAYAARLRRTAMRMPSQYLQALVRSMKIRCVALKDAKGRDFEE